MHHLGPKLSQHGVKKIIPDPDTQSIAYRRSARNQIFNNSVDSIEKAVQEAEITVPEDLGSQVIDYLRECPKASWDSAIADIASRAERDRTVKTDPPDGGGSNLGDAD